MAEATGTTTTDGATPPASSTDGDGTTDAGTTTTPPEGDLGDAGKKALDAERDARKQAEKAARDANRQLEELRRQNMSDNEKALDIAKEEGRAEVRALLAPKLVGAEVRAATAGRSTAWRPGRAPSRTSRWPAGGSAPRRSPTSRGPWSAPGSPATAASR